MLDDEIYAAAKAEDDARELAEGIVDAASTEAVRGLAIARVAHLIETLRRTFVRQVEKASEVESFSPLVRADKSRVASDAAINEALANGLAEKAMAETWIQRGTCGSTWDRKQFRKILGDRFEEWYARELADVMANGRQREVEMFEDDWHPDGIKASMRQRANDRMGKMIYELVQHTRLTVTRELLESRFALGDGTDTTWGEATVQQHEMRVEMLTRNAAGIADTAARHLAAIEMIKESDASCLADLPVAVG